MLSSVASLLVVHAVSLAVWTPKQFYIAFEKWHVVFSPRRRLLYVTFGQLLAVHSGLYATQRAGAMVNKIKHMTYPAVAMQDTLCNTGSPKVLVSVLAYVRRAKYFFLDRS